MTKKERSFLLFILLIFLLFQILPYLYGFIIQGPDKVFSGFIMRWNDNNTYLAKMEQGFDGDTGDSPSTTPSNPMILPSSIPSI